MQEDAVFPIRQTLINGAALAAVLSLVACGQASSPAADNSSAGAPPPAAPSAPLSTHASTQDFVQKAAMSDMFEIQAGRLAETRGGNSAIKAFGRQMVQDHTATSSALQAALRGQTGLPTPPTALDQDHQNMLNDLRNASAADFDQKYTDNQTHAHEDGLNLMQDYAHNGDNAQLRQFASDTAPKIQHHLDMIRQLDQSGADEPSRANPSSGR
jgi:putative membrane protein